MYIYLERQRREFGCRIEKPRHAARITRGAIRLAGWLAGRLTYTPYALHTQTDLCPLCPPSTHHTHQPSYLTSPEQQKYYREELLLVGRILGALLAWQVGGREVEGRGGTGLIHTCILSVYDDGRGRRPYQPPTYTNTHTLPPSTHDARQLFLTVVYYLVAVLLAPFKYIFGYVEINELHGWFSMRPLWADRPVHIMTRVQGRQSGGGGEGSGGGAAAASSRGQGRGLKQAAVQGRDRRGRGGLMR